MSDFYIRIERHDGDPIFLRPGGHAERDLQQAIIDKIRAKGVGFFRSTETVITAVQEALTEVLYEMKSDIIPR